MSKANVPSAARAPRPGSNGARIYCSEQNPEEPLWGSADPVDVWLCLEYRPVWKARAVTDNGLAGPVQRWLADTIAAFARQGRKARPQFIRRPESEGEDVRLLVSVDGRAFEFRGRGYDFLQSLDLPAVLAGPEGSPASEFVRELKRPRYFVCTNGQRDLCCARFGLPVYAALRERVGERAWQVTHLGGHRFAPNVLTFPDACLYGRVSPGEMEEFLRLVEAGDVDFARLRGRTRYPPVVQAAEAALGRPGLRLLHVDGTPEEATVWFAHGDGRVFIRMGRSGETLAVLKSCGDAGAASVYPFVVLAG